MAKYRIKVSVKGDGTTTYEPQRCFFGIFWISLKEHSTYDSWPIIKLSESEAKEAIEYDKELDSSLTDVSITYKEVE